MKTRLLLSLAGCLALASLAHSQPQTPAAVVTAWMEAVKTNDLPSLCSQSGMTLQPAQQAVVASVRDYIPLHVLEYQVKDAQQDGGMAVVTVHEVSQRDPGLLAAFADDHPALAQTLKTGRVEVDEKFYLTRVDGSWQIDFSHSGLPLKGLPWGQLNPDLAGAPNQLESRLAGVLNNSGVAQLMCSLASSAPAAGAIAMVMVPNFQRARAAGQLTACKSNLKNMSVALEMYASDYAGHYPKNLQVLITTDYLRAIPTCPAAGHDSYSAAYKVRSKPDSFSIYCSGQNHAKAYSDYAANSTNYPQYNAERGLIDHP